MNQLTDEQLAWVFQFVDLSEDADTKRLRELQEAYDKENS